MDYQIGFDTVWELDFWGKFRRDVQAAHATVIASEADYDDALVSLTAEVARTYTVIRTFEVFIELTSENAKVQKEGLEIAESRFRNGVVTELDVAQARSLLESTRASIPQLQGGLRQAQNALSTLLGQPPGGNQLHHDRASLQAFTTSVTSPGCMEVTAFLKASKPPRPR